MRRPTPAPPSNGGRPRHGLTPGGRRWAAAILLAIGAHVAIYAGVLVRRGVRSVDLPDRLGAWMDLESAAPEAASMPGGNDVPSEPPRRRAPLATRPVERTTNHESAPPSPSAVDAPPAQAAVETSAALVDGSRAALAAPSTGGEGSTTGTDPAAGSSTPAAPALPAGAAPTDARAAERAYVQRVRASIGRPRYPRSMRRRGIEGTALVGLTVDANGHGSAPRMLHSTGDPALDARVLDHVRERMSPLPPPPAELAWRTHEIRLAYDFDTADD